MFLSKNSIVTFVYTPKILFVLDFFYYVGTLPVFMLLLRFACGMFRWVFVLLGLTYGWTTGILAFWDMLIELLLSWMLLGLRTGWFMAIFIGICGGGFDTDCCVFCCLIGGGGGKFIEGD